MMETSELQLLISIAQETKAGLDNLKGQVDGLGSSFEALKQHDVSPVGKGLRDIGEGGTAAGEGAKKAGDEATGATEKLNKMLESLLSLKEGVEGLIKGFLGLEAIHMFEDMGKDAGKSEGYKNALETIGVAAGHTREELEKTVKSIEAIGYSSDTATKNLTRLIADGLSLEQATKLAQAASAAAFAANKSPEQGLDAFTNAVTRGSSNFLSRQGYSVGNNIQVDHKKQLSKQKADMADKLTNSANVLNSGVDLSDSVAFKTNELAVAEKKLSDTINDETLPAYKDLLTWESEVEKGLLKSVKTWLDTGDNVSTLEDVLEYLVLTFKDLSSTVGDLVVVVLKEAWGLFLDLCSVAKDVVVAIGSIFGQDTEAMTGMEFFVNVLKVIRMAFVLLAGSAEDCLAWINGGLDVTMGWFKLFAYVARAALTPGASMADEWDQKLAEIKDKIVKHTQEIKDIEKKTGDKLSAIALEGPALPKHENKTSAQTDKDRKDAKALQTAKEDAEYAKKQGAAEAKAYANAKRAQEQAEISSNLALSKQELTARGAEDKDAFDQGLITQKEYLDRKENLLIDGNAAEEVAAEANIAILKKERAERAKDGGKGSELLGLDTKIEAAGDKEKLAANKLADDLAALRRTRFDIELKDTEAKQAKLVALYQEGFTQQKAAIAAAYGKGDLTDNEKQQQDNALIDAQVAATQTEIDSKKALIESGTLNQTELDEEIAKYVKLQGTLLSLKASATDYGDALKKTFSDQLGKSILDLTNNVTNLGDAMKKVALSVVQSLQTDVTKNLAQTLTKGLTDATGGGSGIFGTIAGAVGLNSSKPDGSPNQPLWVKEAIGPTSLTKDAGNMIDTLKTKFSDLTDTVKSDFSNVADSLANSLDSLFSSGSTSANGGGGFFSSLFGGSSGGSAAGSGAAAGDFSDYVNLFAAGGGVVTGPGGPTDDQIPAMLSNGEHVTKASQTAKWLPLLNAINSGALDNMAGLSGSKGLAKFASGGLVGSGSGNASGASVGGQVNNISINIDSQGNAQSTDTGDGKNSAALGKAISTAVVQELVKQKRPGGLLAS